MKATDLIKTEEGFRSEAYICSEGYATFGYGSRFIDKDLAEEQLRRDIERIQIELVHSYVYYQTLPEGAKSVLVSMRYQLGKAGLATFKKFHAAMKQRDWHTAAEEMRDSKWYKQTPERVERAIKLLLEANYYANS